MVTLGVSDSRGTLDMCCDSKVALVYDEYMAFDDANDEGGTLNLVGVHVCLPVAQAGGGTATRNQSCGISEIWTRWLHLCRTDVIALQGTLLNHNKIILIMAMTCSRLSSLRCGSCPAYSTPFTPHRIIRNLSLRPVSAASLPLRTLSTSARPAAANSTTAPSPEEPAILTWNEYLRLRKIKRRYNLGSSLIASLILGAGGVTVLASQNLETLQTYFFGLDPLIIMGAGTLGFGAAGWLMGPVLGGAVFGRVYVRWRSAMAEVS